MRKTIARCEGRGLKVALRNSRDRGYPGQMASWQSANNWTSNLAPEKIKLSLGDFVTKGSPEPARVTLASTPPTSRTRCPGMARSTTGSPLHSMAA